MSITEPHLIQPVVANVTLNDIDELTSRMVGWDNDWRQLEAGRPQNRIEVIAGQHTVIQQVRLSHSVHQQGETPSQLVTFGFPESPSQMIWDGRGIPCPAMFDFNGTSGYDAVSGRAFFGVTVSFPKEKFSRIAERLSCDRHDLSAAICRAFFRARILHLVNFGNICMVYAGACPMPKHRGIAILLGWNWTRNFRFA